MKQLLSFALVFACLLSLGGCGSAAPEHAAPAVHSAESAPAGPEEAEDRSQLSGQELAQRAYEQILDSFGGLLPHDPGYPGYPEEFGDAYYEDGCIVVCLTDNSQEMQEKYRALVDSPELLRFREVDCSYGDLYALQEAAASTQGLNFTSIGIDVIENRVEVGIPDLAQAPEALALISQQLPQDLSGRFSELPLVFVESQGADPA